MRSHNTPQSRNATYRGSASKKNAMPDHDALPEILGTTSSTMNNVYGTGATVRRRGAIRSKRWTFRFNSWLQKALPVAKQRPSFVVLPFAVDAQVAWRVTFVLKS